MEPCNIVPIYCKSINETVFKIDKIAEENWRLMGHFDQLSV